MVFEDIIKFREGNRLEAKRAMLDIGERAGSGIPGIIATWEKEFKMKPEYVQSFSPSRVKTFLNLNDLQFAKTSDNENYQAINVAENTDSSDKTSDNIDRQAINQKQEDVKKKLLGIFMDNKEHSVSELSKIVNLSMPRTRAIISELSESGKIIPLGANKNRTYIVSTDNGE